MGGSIEYSVRRERSDVMCRACDIMMDELEAQRQAYVQQEHHEHDREVDSGIQMPTSTPYRPRNQCHSDTVFPSSSPEWFHRGIPITFIQTSEINSIPIRSSGNQSQSHVQYAGQEIWELEKRLEECREGD